MGGGSLGGATRAPPLSPSPLCTRLRIVPVLGTEVQLGGVPRRQASLRRGEAGGEAGGEVGGEVGGVVRWAERRGCAGRAGQCRRGGGSARLWQLRQVAVRDEQLVCSRRGGRGGRRRRREGAGAGDDLTAHRHAASRQHPHARHRPRDRV